MCKFRVKEQPRTTEMILHALNLLIAQPRPTHHVTEVPTLESIKDLSDRGSGATLSLLQLEAMPLLRKAKNCSKGADPGAVQQLLSCARSLFVPFGKDVLGRMQDCAPFIFKEMGLFDSEPAPAEDFAKSVEELKASNQLWHELDTEIFPAAAGTAAASPPPDMKKYLMYAELAQEVAATTLSDAPAPSLQALRSRLVDLLEPEAWASIEASVTGPTLETPPHL